MKKLLIGLLALGSFSSFAGSCNSEIDYMSSLARSAGYAEGKANEVAQTDIDRDRDRLSASVARNSLAQQVSITKKACNPITSGISGKNLCSRLIDNLVSAAKSTGYAYARAYEVAQVDIEEERYLGYARSSEVLLNYELKKAKTICKQESKHMQAESGMSLLD